LDNQVDPIGLPIHLGLEWGAHFELWPHALPQGSPKVVCELGISIQHNVFGEAMMLGHVHKEQPSCLWGNGTKCAILLNWSTTTMIASNPFDGGKLTMKSMDTLSRGPLRIGNWRTPNSLKDSNVSPKLKTVEE